jgi:toxin ParE1/3/4
VIRIILADEARADALGAFAFYESRRPGLGERFREHVDSAISKIQRSPERYPVVYRDLRRRRVERFPYAVFYRVYPGVVVVVALMHGRQDPSVWKDRAHQNEPG